MKKAIPSILAIILASSFIAGCLGGPVPPVTPETPDTPIDGTIPTFLDTWDMNIGSAYNDTYGYRPSGTRQVFDNIAYAGTNFEEDLQSIGTSWLRNKSNLYVFIERGNDLTFDQDGSTVTGEVIDQVVVAANSEGFGYDYTNMINGTNANFPLEVDLITPSIVDIFFGESGDASILTVGLTETILPIDSDTTFNSVRITYLYQQDNDLWFQDVIVA